MNVLVPLMTIALLVGGCSLDASLMDLAATPSVIFQGPAKTTGLTSGSSQAGTASGGGVTYYLQSTVGSYTSGIEQTTSDNSYKIYSSVQGAIISE